MLAGDAAYPNISWIIKPYPGKNLTPEEESFSTLVLVAGLWSKMLSVD